MKIPIKIIITLIIVLYGLAWYNLYQTTKIYEIVHTEPIQTEYKQLNIEIPYDFCGLNNTLCLAKEVVAKKQIDAIVYGYNSEVGQTDNSPFITASNQTVRDGIVANNCQPFGTKVEIDNKMFEVQDRMNSRYGCEVFDIWFENKQDALNWGKRNKLVIIH